MSAYDISIVICTRNRAHALRGLLDSLTRLDLDGGPTTEVLLVDNNSTDATKTEIEAFADRAPFAVRYIFESRAGLGAAHNAALPRASGDILLFTDDDCIVAPDWAKRVAATFSDRLEPKIVGGRVELYNPADAPITIKSSKEPDELRDFPGILDFLYGCNFAVSRQVFAEVGPFDACFGPGTRFFAADETDLVYRALRRGIRIVYDPDQLVYHNHGRSIEQARKLMSGYLIATGALTAKHFVKGDPALLKISYWNLLRRLKSPGERFAALVAFAQTMRGFMRYLCYEAGRRSTSA